jgi:hypothetical protein
MRRTSRLIALCLAGALSASMPCIAIAEEQSGTADAAATQTETEAGTEQSADEKAVVEEVSDATDEAADTSAQEPSEASSTDAENITEDSSKDTDSAISEPSKTQSSDEAKASDVVATDSESASASEASDESNADSSEAASSTADTSESDTAAVSDGIYTIETAIDSSKSIDIPGASANSGTSVQIYSDNQTPAQRFSFTKGSDGSYTIRNTSSQLVLDVEGAVAANGTRVQQYRANGTDAQKWELVSNADGSYSILSWLKGANGLRFALDVPSAQASNGVSLWIWERNGSKAQNWSLAAAQTVQDGTYEIYSGIGSERVIDVAGNSEASGANVDSYRENGTMAQRFAVFYDSASGYYTIKNAGTGRALDVTGASTSAGANVWQYKSNGTNAQKWALVAKDNGTWEIVNASSGLALDIADGSSSNGANIQQWYRNGTSAQTWTLISINPLASGRYVIASSTNRRFALDAQWGSINEGTPVQLYSRNGSAAQTYEISPSSEDGYYVIRNVSSGKYLTIDGTAPTSNGASISLSAPEGPADYQLWKPTMTENGITLLSKLGLVLDIDSNGMWDGNKVQGWTSNGTSAQRFYLVAAGTGKLGITDFMANVADAKGTDHETLSSRVDGDSYLFLPAYAGNTISIVTYRSDGGTTIYVSPTRDNAGKSVSTSFSLDLTSSDVRSINGCWVAYVRENPADAPTKLIIMRSANIGSLFLESADKYSQGRIYVEASPGHSYGADGKTYALIEADGNATSGELSQIKGRGNSTWLMDKRPYQIKLSKKASLVDGTKGNASKKWVLLANYADPTLLRNSIVLNTAYELGLTSTPQCRTIDLYYDGEYRGTYLLTEKVEVGKGRVDIEEIENTSTSGANTDTLPVSRAVNSYGNEFQYVSGLKQAENNTGGYLLEMDVYYGGERSWFTVQAGGRTYHIVLKSPEDATEEQVRYISEYVQEQINNIGTDSLGSFDLDSLARTFLVEEFAKNVDYIRHSSTYMYKDQDSAALMSGPVWDFDLALGNDRSGLPTGIESESYAFFLNNASFRQQVRKIFNEELKPLVQKTLLGQDEQGGLASISSMVDKISASQKMNQVIWPNFYGSEYQIVPQSTYEGNVAVLQNFVSQRLAWLDTYLNSSQWIA